jgi:hypothetical protein
VQNAVGVTHRKQPVRKKNDVRTLVKIGFFALFLSLVMPSSLSDLASVGG